MISRATEAWRSTLEELLRKGKEIAPASLGGDWRGRTTRELLAYQTRVPLAAPVLLCPGRKLGYLFMLAEAAQVLTGDNRLATIYPFAKQLRDLSEDGYTMSGAYGPPFVDQLSFIYKALTADAASRQAVVSLWRPRPAPGGEIPCTLTLQWLVREGVINCVVAMRSSDAWMGLPYDWFTFSAMTAFVALLVRPKIGSLGLGDLVVTAGSQHLYKIDWDAATECAARSTDDLIVPTIEPLNLEEFEEPDALTRHLWALAKRDGTARHRWLTELSA